MKKRYEITTEEFEAIKETIEKVLNLWHYDFISADDGMGSGISMSKEQFFEALKGEFIIKRSANQK